MLSSSQGDTLVPRSHHAECCGQIKSPESSASLTLGFFACSGNGACSGDSGIPSALEAFTTGHIFPCHSQCQVPAMLPGLMCCGCGCCQTAPSPSSPRMEGVCAPHAALPANPQHLLCREGAQQGCGVSRMLCPGSDACPAFPARIPWEPLPPVHQDPDSEGQNGLYLCSSVPAS